MLGSLVPLLEFWNLRIYRERLKLETSILAIRRMAVSSKAKNAKFGQKISCGVTLPYFEILGPA